MSSLPLPLQVFTESTRLTLPPQTRIITNSLSQIDISKSEDQSPPRRTKSEDHDLKEIDPDQTHSTLAGSVDINGKEKVAKSPVGNGEARRIRFDEAEEVKHAPNCKAVMETSFTNGTGTVLISK